VNGSSLEVVGVMPPGFGLPNIKGDIYTPLQLPKSAPRDGRNFRAVARLQAGISVAQAQSEMQAIARQTEVERPEMNTNWSATAVPLMEQVVGNVRTSIGVLLGSVVFLLMIACANVANLLLMRSTARRREVNVRLALGARRTDLFRQLMTESLMLAALGGISGVFLARVGIAAILASLPANFPLPRLQEIRIDTPVLMFTTIVTLAVGIIFGTFPILFLRHEKLSESLMQSGRAVVRGQQRIGAILVGVEVAVALVLATGAGLMIRSFERLTTVDTGFRSDHMLTARMLLLPSKYGAMERRTAVIQDILQHVRSLPAVASAGSIHFLPMSGTNSGTWYYRSDRPKPDPGNMSGGDVSVISDGYFRTLGIPIIAGRDFDVHDGFDAPKVAILNQSAAQTLFPGENAIGKHVAVAWERQPDAEIIGVVADARHDDLNHQAGPCLFLPESQEPHLLLSLVIRTAGNPELLAHSVEQEIHNVDPEQGIAEIKTMDDLINDSVASPRLQRFLISVFGFVALTLAAVGIYGTISHSVVQRTREIGVRLAVGATPGTILRFVLRDGLTITALGTVCGIVGAFGLTRYLEGLLYEVSPQDPTVFVAVVGLIFLVAAAACIVPALRAARVDPATVLHAD
jgi:putative ABC transport system permease protein